MLAPALATFSFFSGVMPQLTLRPPPPRMTIINKDRFFITVSHFFNTFIREVQNWFQFNPPKSCPVSCLFNESLFDICRLLGLKILKLISILGCVLVGRCFAPLLMANLEV